MTQPRPRPRRTTKQQRCFDEWCLVLAADGLAKSLAHLAHLTADREPSADLIQIEAALQQARQQIKTLQRKGL